MKPPPTKNIAFQRHSNIDTTSIKHRYKIGPILDDKKDLLDVNVIYKPTCIEIILDWFEKPCFKLVLLIILLKLFVFLMETHLHYRTKNIILLNI